VDMEKDGDDHLERKNNERGSVEKGGRRLLRILCNFLFYIVTPLLGEFPCYRDFIRYSDFNFLDTF